ncbi:MAG TPA: peptidoglycan recognition family protein [Verrucomicrobiae bacterium]|nr:peptidoglycan recognition family protein [Verrucomicrobiae bacterium]
MIAPHFAPAKTARCPAYGLFRWPPLSISGYTPTYGSAAISDNELNSPSHAESMQYDGSDFHLTFLIRGLQMYAIMFSHSFPRRGRCLALLVPIIATAAGSLFLAGCRTAPRLGSRVARTGDEIMVAGQLFHTGTPVVLWTDPGGYDAYRVERRFAPIEESDWETSHEQVRGLRTPNRYGMRKQGLTPEEIERFRGGGWDLPALQRMVDEFVIHFDVCGVSRQCFKVLQDYRDLSVHFMLDLDGTIYQTLDLKERAWQATTANTRSIGIEIANMGAYGTNEDNPLADWYTKDADGKVRITIPPKLGDGGIRTKNFVGHPARPGLIKGVIQGQELEQYDFTPQQYAALTKLTATLCKIFPRITCDYPKDQNGKLITHKLPDDQLNNYHGVLGHFHVQTDKTDPGPAFQWDRVIDGARRLLNGGMSEQANEASLGHMRSNPNQ